MNREHEKAENLVDSQALTQEYLRHLQTLSKNFNLAQQSDQQIEQLARWFCRELLKKANQDTNWLRLDDRSNRQMVQELHRADRVQTAERELIAIFIADKIVCAELRWRKACYELLQLNPALHARLGLVSDRYLLEQSAHQQAAQNAQAGWMPKFLQHFAGRVWRPQFGQSQASQDAVQDVASCFEDAIIELYSWIGRAYPRAESVEVGNFKKRPRQDLPSYLEQITQYRQWLCSQFAKQTKTDFGVILARAASQRWYIKLP